jgi:protein-L-isoaspartate(D-aspartate) O-methyltransferase
MYGFNYRREQMVQELRERGIDDPRVLAALRRVPRHRFVSQPLVKSAYGDHALPIGASQTISQPYVVARMTELLELEAHHSVLEIGTGSGYQTAVLAHLVRCVYSIERVAGLAQAAIGRIRQLQLNNVKIQIFDGTVGWSEVAPFDRILVTAAAPEVPPPLVDQLATGGRLLVPVGDRSEQRLILVDNGPHGLVEREGERVAFVPLLGRYGFAIEH